MRLVVGVVRELLLLEMKGRLVFLGEDNECEE